MSDLEPRKPVPAWSIPGPGSTGRWLGSELIAGALALVAIVLFGVVLVVSAALASPWPMVGIGAVGTSLLVRHRSSGRAFLHALWVASLFLLLLGLVVLAFTWLAGR